MFVHFKLKFVPSHANKVTEQRDKERHIEKNRVTWRNAGLGLAAIVS